MRYLVLLLLLFGLEGKAQSYTFTLNECRVEATTGELRESFLVDRIRYFDRGDQTFIFDHESVLSVFDANITNYGRDSLKALIDIWIDSCNVVPIPTPPAPSALFANTTSLDLDGATELVTVPDPLDVFSFTDGAGNDEPFSASIWVYENTLLGNYLIKLIPPNYEWYLYRAGNNIVVRLYSGGTFTSYLQILHTRTTTNEWFHLAITYDGSELQSGLNMYVDGVNVGTKSTVGTYLGMSITGVNLRICDVTDGKIDQPTVFNKELTVSEIKELMALRDYSYFSDTASIISSWYMDAPDDLGVAGGVTDRFGSNDGTGVNTTTADNLVPCIEWPYDYQLDSASNYYNLTPMQTDSDASAFGGFGIDLDGSNEYILTNDSPLLSFTNDTVYMGAWISMDDATSFPIIEKTDEYLFWVNASDILEVRFIDQSTGGYIGRTYNTALTGWQGQWIYVEALLFGNTSASIDLRLNGALVDDTDANSGSYTAMEDRATSLLIGNSGAAYADGRIGDIWISNDRNNEYNEHQPTDLTLLGDNLAVYYRGYNSTNTASGVLDQSGNGLNGIPTNTDLADFKYDSPRSIFEADSAGSFEFDGVSQTTTYPSNAITTDWSISMWYYLNSVTGNPNFFIDFGTSQLAINFGKIYFEGLSTDLTSASSIAVGQWYHLTLTHAYDSDLTSKLYINGILDKTTITSQRSLNVVRIGSGGGGSFQYLSGKMSNVTTYNRILTECEVQEIYNDGSPVDPRLTTVSANAINHWRLNAGDDVNGTVLDIIGTKNGTSVNTPTLNETSYPTN